MKIQNNLPIYTNKYPKYYATQPKFYAASYNTLQKDTVNFMGSPSLITNSVISGQSKLIKLLNRLLEAIPREISDEELKEIMLSRYAAFERGLINRLAQIEQRAIDLTKNLRINPQQYINERNEIFKELNRIKKSRPEPITFFTKSKENVNDFELINKFKTAIMDNNFDLKKVFIEHYSKLKEMNTIEEVKETYPDIILPIRPEIVIADKLVSKSLTREFFEELDRLIEAEKGEETDALVAKHVNQIVNSLALDKYNLNKKEFFKKIEKKLYERISYTLNKAHETGSFSFVPMKIKQKGDMLSPDDYKLISIDFDKFVLNTLEEQYLHFTKLKDINIQGINAFSIKDPDYKFDKINSKVLSIISEAARLRDTQRNYEKFNQLDLINRLNFYVERYGENENILEPLIEFADCKFKGEDMQLCTKMLKELDAVFDEEQSLDEAITKIKRENIHPIGTEKFNETEHQKAIENARKEQKLSAKLRNKQEKFDEIINILNRYNMNYAANTCAKFRPASLSESETRLADSIINIIQSEISKDGTIPNKVALDTKISRWSAYNEYVNKGVNDNVLNEAQEFATQNGNINILEAGKYLINHELVSSYPKSLEFAKEKDILQLIMNETNGKKACEYLCKYSTYADMTTVERTKILDILKHFDLTDNIDREILKIICEKYYSKVDTTVKSLLNKGGQTVDSTITASAKQEMMEYYKFPGYLDYLPAFERALYSHTTSKGKSGIKLLGSNNKTLTYNMEIKIKFKNSIARLVSTNNDYVFDKFIPLGLH